MLLLTPRPQITPRGKARRHHNRHRQGMQQTQQTQQTQAADAQRRQTSPAARPGHGMTRTVSGLLRRKANVPVSHISAAILSAGVSPGIGTVSRPMPQTAE